MPQRGYRFVAHHSNVIFATLVATLREWVTTNVAKKNGFDVKVITEVARDGKPANSKKVALPPYDNFLDIAFSSQEKEHSALTQAADGSYFVLRVDKVVPEQQGPPTTRDVFDLR